jgi:TolB-like protein
MEEPGESGSLYVPAGYAEAPARQRRVFISYASHDAPVSQKVCSALEASGFLCWMAPRDVRPGTVYADAIVGAINEAQVVVLVLSGSAVASSHVGKEVERASSKRKSIIAFRIDAAPLSRALEYFLSESQWIDVPALGMPAAMAKLVEAVGQGTATPAQQIPATKRADGTMKRFAIAGTILICVGAATILGVHFRSLDHRSAQPIAAISDKSIAVLPFADMSEKKDQDYFADGMAEQILDLLAKIPAIKVIGRTSSFQFKGKNEDLRTIGAKLGVAYVLEGSVRKSTNKVRITAQLIEAQSGTHRWSDTYERDAGDVLKLQDDIAGGIARALQIAVGADDFQARPTLSHPEAYDVYLQGNYAFNRQDKEGIDESIGYFRQALELDPTFADAAVALSFACEMQANFAFVAPAVGFEQARRAADAALKLDPSLAIAHAVIGSIAANYDWDWKAADRQFQMALKLKPHDPFVLAAAGTLELALGHYANAARRFRESVMRDPLDASNYELLSWAQIRLGQVTEAIATERKALEIQPGRSWTSTYLAAWLLVRGEPDAALAAVQHEDPTIRSGGLSIVYWALGRKAEAEAALKQFIAEQADSNAYGIAWAYAYRHDRDGAFKWLERAYAQKDPGLVAIKGEPLLANLEGDPRYKAFLRKLNLPE